VRVGVNGPAPQAELAQDLVRDLSQALAQALDQGGPLGLRQACAQALVLARGLDAPGAEAVLAAQADLGRLLAAGAGALA
jgi:hypothetical protein